MLKRNLNTRFSENPATLDIQRSVLDRINNHKTTFNASDLIPVYCKEILPGDTVSMDTSFLVRMSTPIFPVMDNAFMDLFWFFVPNRLVFDKWKEMMGENDVNAWAQTVEYTTPYYISEPGENETFTRGSLADYFGLPTNVPICTPINIMPFRGYDLIWNEYFRDQNLQVPVLIDKSPGEFYIGSSGGPVVRKVNRVHDYFSSSLPQPQKGAPVVIGFDNVPVVTGPNNTLNDFKYWNGPSDNSTYNLHWYVKNGNLLTPQQYYSLSTQYSGVGYASQATILSTTETETGNELTSVLPYNLHAKTDSLSLSVNMLRQAFQVQKLLERDARGGTRYWEMLKSHFSVTAPDASLQRPEYLGSSRTYINMTQVVQQSSTDGVSPQGNTAAFSKTSGVENSFTKSFVEHGFLFGLVCIRTDRTYQQGIEKMWSRRGRLDYYWPVLSNIGEQPVMLKELYYDGQEIDPDNEEIWGYQEAWGSYRYSPSYVTGGFRSNVDGSLDSWHYADYYESRPFLSADWIKETTVNVDRTLAVQSELEDQFLADFYFKSKWSRPMPVYSVPGLIDHH